MDMITESKKPPLGVMPQRIWKEQRCDELLRAIIEYAEVGLLIMPEWVDEFNYLTEELKSL